MWMMKKTRRVARPLAFDLAGALPSVFEGGAPVPVWPRREPANASECDFSAVAFPARQKAIPDPGR